MGLVQASKNKIIEALGGTTEESIAGSTGGVRFPGSPGVDPDEHLWQPLFGPKSSLMRSRNLAPLMHEQMLERAGLMFMGNPIGKRIINITGEYIVSNGIQFQAEDRNVNEILARHWTDTTNNWSVLQFERLRDLGLWGESVIPAFVNSVNGHVTLGNIDPILIERVVDNPANAMKPMAIVLKKLVGESFRRAYKIIDVADVNTGAEAYGRLVGLPKDEKEVKAFGFEFMLGQEGTAKDFHMPQMHFNTKIKWSGSVFFMKINSPMTANRGWSDLLDTLDWLDAHDQFLFSQVEKAIDSAKFVWDIEVEGMNKTQLKKFAQDTPAFSPGHRWFHTPQAKMNVQSPNLHLEDASVLGNSLKNHTMAGAGMPPIWFAESLVSRASAPEMTEPTFKHLTIRQRIAATMISTIFRFAIDQAALKDRLKVDRRKNDEPSTFYLKMPDLSAKDQRMLAISMKNYSGSLKDGVDTGFLEQGEATDLYARYLEQTGLDAWKDEPFVNKLPGPDDSTKPSRVFTRAKESTNGEFTMNGSSFYVSIIDIDEPESDVDKLLTAAGIKE
jgi:hypothetical protein